MGLSSGYINGFEIFPSFTHLVMQCVTSTSFIVLVNGTPRGPIILSRGLRQGVPLSPYLFLLCTESLVSLLKKSALYRSIVGVRVCRGAPTINHLLFANDNLIFCKATRSSSISLLNLLNTYARASGQCINTEKTTMVFIKNVGEIEKEGIMNLWGGRQTQQYKKYLGFLPMVGRSRKKNFSKIKTKLWQRLQVWKEKLLSQGGKEVLLKVVALALPMHAMSCFRLPLTLCSELESLIANFWWG